MSLAEVSRLLTPCFSEQNCVPCWGGQVVALQQAAGAYLGLCTLPGRQAAGAYLGLRAGEGGLAGLGYGCLECLVLEQVPIDKCGMSECQDS